MILAELPGELLLEVASISSSQPLMLVNRAIHNTILQLVPLHFFAQLREGATHVPPISFKLGTNITRTGHYSPRPSVLYVEGKLTMLAARTVARESEVRIM